MAEVVGERVAGGARRVAMRVFPFALLLALPTTAHGEDLVALRLLITEVRVPGREVQLQEFRLFDQDGVRVVPISATNPGGNSPARQGVSNAFDGDTESRSSKWLDMAMATHGHAEVVISVRRAAGRVASCTCAVASQLRPSRAQCLANTHPQCRRRVTPVCAQTSSSQPTTTRRAIRPRGRSTHVPPPMRHGRSSTNRRTSIRRSRASPRVRRLLA
jgi:hypothetical protein